MTGIRQRLAKANTMLAAFAVPHGDGLGRVYPEPEDDTRFPFQRDRDRIIHTQAFRRLKHKTQVFVAGHGDHYRTRITHTLEVMQVGRSMARGLAVNEDLTEAIALAHDLGHTPFGHAGEEAMTECMEPFGKRFEHNEQSLRIAEVLEHHCRDYTGLNLNQEVLEGILKHRTPYDAPTDQPLPQRSPSIEAQIVNLADEIAYTAHDTDDGLRAGLISIDDLSAIPLAREAIILANKRGGEVRGSIVHLLVADLFQAIAELLEANRIRSLADVYTARQPLVAFSQQLAQDLAALRSFLWQRLYLSPQVQLQASQGKQTIHNLFAAYMLKPPAKVRSLLEKNGGALEDAVKDYIAGMTDSYATEMAKQL